MGEALQANGEQTFSRPGRCLARDVVRVERHACRGVTMTVLQTCPWCDPLSRQAKAGISRRMHRSHTKQDHVCLGKW